MTSKLEWEKKVWGKCLHVFNSEYAAVSYLVVNEGFQCSRHYHTYRINQFNVISGRIIIEEWENEKLSKTILQAGETYIVCDRVVHRFRVLESGQIIEVYWSDHDEVVSINDIVRLDEGGPIEK